MNVHVTPGMPLTLVAILAGAVLALAIMLSVAYIYKEFAKAKLIYGGEQGPSWGSSSSSSSCHAGSTERSPNHREIRSPGGQCCSGRHRRTITGFYFVFWIVYSLTFTFTVLFALLTMALQGDLDQLSRIDAFQRDMRNLTSMTSVRIDRHGNDELLQQSSMATDMRRSCSVYIGELLEGVAKKVEELMSVEHLALIHGNNGSVSHLLFERTGRHLDEYSRMLGMYGDAYRRRVEAGVSQSVSKYYRYLQVVLNSDWFSFPRLLFNGTRGAESRYASPVLGVDQRSGPHVFESQFGSFLEVEEVEDMRLWTIQFWQRSVYDRGHNDMQAK